LLIVELIIIIYRRFLKQDCLLYIYDISNMVIFKLSRYLAKCGYFCYLWICKWNFL